MLAASAERPLCVAAGRCAQLLRERRRAGGDMSGTGCCGAQRRVVAGHVCGASAAMDERLEVTSLVMVTVSSSGGGDSDTEESHNSPALFKLRK